MNVLKTASTALLAGALATIGAAAAAHDISEKIFDFAAIDAQTALAQNKAPVSRAALQAEAARGPRFVGDIEPAGWVANDSHATPKTRAEVREELARAPAEKIIGT